MKILLIAPYFLNLYLDVKYELERQFFYYLFSIMVIYFFYKKKYVDEKTVALGMSVFLSYFLFAHLTGELGSTIPTFLILGITMKLIYLEEENLKNKHE